MTTRSVVLIVGGTRGIGLDVARYLSDRGYLPVVAGRSEVNFPDSIQLDVLEERSVALAMKGLKEKYGKLDGLVYSTGITRPQAPVEQFDAAAFRTLVDTNVTGALLCLKYAYPMLRDARGKIVVVNSVAGRIGSRLSGYEYTISKTALSGMVKHFALQFAPDGVFINSVLPGMTRTAMLEESVSAETIATVATKVPLGRIAEPDDISPAVEFLLSERNTYITGSGIDVNGGLFLNG